MGGEDLTDLAAWSGATGWDRNSRMAPLIYSKLQDRNGRLAGAGKLPSAVSNFTPDFNVGPQSVNAYPYTGGGTYILDVPQNWKPCGRSGPAGLRARHATRGRLAARAYWYVAHADYRRTDGSRASQDMYRVYLPPEQMPAGSFCQDAATGRVYVRMPADAADPCPIGTHRKLAPQQAIGHYVGREADQAAAKYRGKLVTAELAQAMTRTASARPTRWRTSFPALFGTPTLERGCPIQGLSRRRQPAAARGAGDDALRHPRRPGRYDIGAWQHGYWSQ